MARFLRVLFLAPGTTLKGRIAGLQFYGVGIWEGKLHVCNLPTWLRVPPIGQDRAAMKGSVRSDSPGPPPKMALFEQIGHVRF